MILIGQYDSPFVRRVAIALHHYQMEFEHRPWSVWADADEIAAHNPLRRVPTLILEDGYVVLETFAILDTLDEGAGGARSLAPSAGLPRRDVLRVSALASGLADKAVALLYSSLALTTPSARWAERCRTQIIDTLAMLEAERIARKSAFWFSASLSHADIAVACSYRFAREAHPSLFAAEDFPSVDAHSNRCEALPEFSRAYLPITNNL